MPSVPISAVNTLTAEALLGFLLPVIFLAVWRKKYRLNLFPLFLGVVAYAVFEQIAVLLLGGAFIKTFPALANLTAGSFNYALYAGAVTALFGEAGRYISFRYSINEKCPGLLNSVTYGIGHGGAEFIVNLGFSAAFYALFAASVNGGVEAEVLAGTLGGDISAVEPTIAAVSAAGISQLLLLLTERLCVFAMNILLSAAAYIAADNKNIFIPLGCFVFHAAVCVIATYCGSLFVNVILLGAISAGIYFVFRKDAKA